MVVNPKPQAPWGEYVPYVGYMTVEQFEQFPGENGWIYELDEGRLICMPGPGNEHADLQEHIITTLGSYIRQHKLGRMSGTGCFNLPLPGNTEEVLCPDMYYLQPGRKANMPKRGSYLVGAPDLVIEIASPNDTHPEMAKKISKYLKAGVQLVWVLWPHTQTVDVWRPTALQQPIATLKDGDMLDGLAVVPGFRCTVQDIFQG